MEIPGPVEGKIIRGAENLAQILAVWRFKGYKTIFTNGCFDILHRGHADYLRQAALLGDKLILGLNTDASVSRIKGPTRPVIDQESRALVMASLFFVDLVVFFDEDTPYGLIKTVLPDVLVKGGDYHADDIVGADIVRKKGGEVCTIPLTPGFSTTDIIEKILKTS